MLFEGIALCLCAPVMSYVLGKSLFDTGVLTIALATCAMLWNMLYNAMFERVEKKFGFKRTVPVRIGHAVGFGCERSCAKFANQCRVEYA